MSSLSADRLYALLPSMYRVRDAEQGEPLLALMSLLAREIEAIEENVDQLYDDQFIETCAEWVAPYIGSLIGHRPLHGVATRVASPRAEVANTIAYRRRKGTAAMLEQLARDVTDWPARAVEFFEQLATTQYMNHVRLHALATADVRSVPRMLDCRGPFNTVAHTVEVRRPETGAGRYNIPNIGILLWRLEPHKISRVPLSPDPGDAAGRKFRLNPLSADQQLFRLPVTEPVISHIAEPANVPQPLRVRELALQMRAAQQTTEVVVSTPDYGEDRSFALHRGGVIVPINRPGPPSAPGDPPSPAIPEIRIADLRDVFDSGGTVIGWAHEDGLLPEDIAIDPERGRILFGTARAAEHAADPFLGSYHYGFSRAMGGGEYERTPAGSSLTTQTTASQGEALAPHLAAIVNGGRLTIADSLTYAAPAAFTVNGVTAAGAPGHEVVVTGGNGSRPILAATGTIALEIGARGTLVLEGLVIRGGALALAPSGDDEPRTLVLRHCTLVPGLDLEPDGTAVSPGVPSLIISDPTAIVEIDQCIVGALRVDVDARLTITGSIVDAGAADAVAMEGAAAGASGGDLTIDACTVVGKVHVRRLVLASDTMFVATLATPDPAWPAPLWVDRKQDGCVRFSVVPAGSLVPRRFRCLPDDAHPDVVPHFTSLRYGDPGYGQLRRATAEVIRTGAHDEGEIGAMHPLYQPLRETNLRIRLDEYLRFGLHAGIFYVT